MAKADLIATLSDQEVANRLAQTGHGYIGLAQREGNYTPHRMKTALKCFMGALELDARQLEAYFGLAALAIIGGDPAKARDFLLQAQHAAPRDPRPKLLLTQLDQLSAQQPLLEPPDLTGLYGFLTHIRFEGITPGLLKQRAESLVFLLA